MLWFTISVNIKDGTLHFESEDWSGKSEGNCDDSKSNKCSNAGSISGGQALFGKTIHIRWMYQNKGDRHTYTGSASYGSKTATGQIVNPTSPGLNGKLLIPFQNWTGNGHASDKDRIRVDSAGLTHVDFHGGPVVRILPKTGCYGDLGYIDAESIQDLFL